jgi:hypothetical protein
VPAPVGAPRPATAAPAAIKPAAPGDAAKKETSKVTVTPPSRPAPQATVKIGSSAPAAKPAATIKPAATAEDATEAAPDQLTGLLAIAATVVALAALGVQLWMYLLI